MNQSLAVLPADVAATASHQRFLRLPHPRTGLPSLFLPAKRQRQTDNDQEEDGAKLEQSTLLEVQAINATGDKQRSWFVGGDTVVGDGKLLLLTPFDSLFLLIRILASVRAVHGEQGRSLPYDDIFEEAAESTSFSDPSVSQSASTDYGSETRASKRARFDAGLDGDEQDGQVDYLLREDFYALSQLRCVRKRMGEICEVQEITPTLSTYRLSPTLLLPILQHKVDVLSKADTFQISPVLARLLAKEGIGDGQGVSNVVVTEARIKTSLDILCGYLTVDWQRLLSQQYEFPNLAKYLANSTAHLLPSDSYMPGLKIPSSTDDFKTGNTNKSVPKTASTKAKKTQAESLGVRALKKASTRGMSPLTSFFQKKSPTPSPTPTSENGSATPGSE